MADYVCKHKCFLYIAVELFLVFPTKHNHYMHEYSVLHCYSLVTGWVLEKGGIDDNTGRRGGGLVGAL